MMPKLLVFHPYVAPYRIDLYNRLAADFKVKVLLTGSKKELQSLGFDLDYVNQQAQFDYEYCSEGVYLGRHLISLKYQKAIRSFNPDIVLAHELGVNTLIAISLKKKYKYQLFVTIDDSPSMIKNIRGLRKKLQSLVIKKIDVMLVVHPEVKEHLQTEFEDKSNCDFVFFPIIQDEVKLLGKLKYSEYRTKELKKEYRLENKKVILFVGRLEDVKNPDQLLESFIQINSKDAVLVFVGEGTMKSSLMASVKAKGFEGQVIFTGRLTGRALYAWYSIASVFVLPSRFEPFGAVVNEALVAGCKVIVSNRVGASCLVNKNNGLTYNFTRDQDLKNSLELVLNQIKSKKVTNNKMPFSINCFVDDFLNQFQNKKC